MDVKKTSRGFELIDLPEHVATTAGRPERRRLVQQSSAVGDYPDALAKPGSSYLWVGKDHHLDRSQVGELVAHLTRWLATGSLEGEAVPEPSSAPPPPAPGPKPAGSSVFDSLTESFDRVQILIEGVAGRLDEQAKVIADLQKTVADLQARLQKEVGP